MYSLKVDSTEMVAITIEKSEFLKKYKRAV
jgi:hypothetical protein